MSNGKINSIKTSNHGITQNLSYYPNKSRIWSTFNHRNIVNIYIVHEISKSINISDYPIAENCLFGAVTLTKNADIDKQKYSGYGIGLGRNVIIFGVDMSSSTKIDNRKKDILILGKGPTQGLVYAVLRVMKKCIQLILQSTIKSSV